jgi:uncharacterized membrane protein YhiD involved in acid resistance
MNFDFQPLFVHSLSPLQALLQLTSALVCGIIIAFVYRKTYRGVNYATSQVIALLMLAMITALIIMVIGNNLARAFGLVGAMSIIRFRTAIKDTQDILFIFFALAAGLACGAGMYAIALTGTLFISLTTWLAILIQEENPIKKEYLLHILLQDDTQEEAIQKALQQGCKQFKLINAKTVGEPAKLMVEYAYYVTLKRTSDGSELVRKLKQVPAVYKVNLFFDEA